MNDNHNASTSLLLQGTKLEAVIASNTKQMNYYLSLLIFAITCLNACNADHLRLEEADAKKQIVKYFEARPQELTGTDAFQAMITRGKDSGSNNIAPRLYKNAGLLKLKETKPNKNSDSIHIYEITEAGKPYVIKTQVSKNGYPILVVKTFDYYVDEITGIKYSPDKKEAAAYFTKSINNLTPFGKEAANPQHKVYLIGFFQLDNNRWKFQRIEVDVDRIWEMK